MSNRNNTLAVVLGSVGELGIFVAPFLLGVLVDWLSVEPGEASLIISFQFICIAVGSFLSALFLHRTNLKLLGLIAVLLMLGGNVLTMASDSIVQVVAFRGVTGLGEGGCIGIAFGMASQAANADRVYSTMMFVEVGLAIVFLFFLPGIIDAVGYQGPFLVMACAAACLMPLALLVPRKVVRGHAAPAHAPSVLFKPQSLFLLTGLVIITAGTETLWVYFERIGQSIGLSLKQLAHYGTMSISISLLGPVIAFFLGASLGRTLPILMALIMYGIGALVITHTATEVYFVGAVIVESVLISFLLPFARGTMAEIDRTGAVAAASGSAFFLGSTLGPGLSGVILLLGGSYQEVGWIVAGLFVLAFAILFPFTSRLDRKAYEAGRVALPD